MKFGLALPQYDYSLPGPRPIGWSEVRDWAQKAEDLGFNSVWVSDHLFLDVAKYGGPDDIFGAMECWTTLAGLATSTDKVRLGSLVVCNDLRPPALVAKMAATVDVLSAGRLEVGLGAGWYEPDFTAAGLPFHGPGVRIDRLAEATQVITGMLSESPFSFDGKFYEITDAINLPQGVQEPRLPVFIGGKGDRVTRMAARYADGYNAVWAWTPERFKGRLDVLNAAAVEAGRDPTDIRKTVGLYVLPGEDEEALAERYRTYLAASPPGVGSVEQLDEWKADKLAGDPSHMSEVLKGFEALGVAEVILGFGLLPFQIADPDAVDWFASQIPPILKEKG